MPESLDVVVVGAGQAGLSLSHELSHAGIEHLVLERGRVGETWRGRWDTFCLVTPNWSVQLPGGHYSGKDPDGFMPRDDVVGHLVGYAESFRAPVREDVEVTEVQVLDGGGFRLHTSAGAIQARRLVLAAGGYQKPHRPAGAKQLPPWLTAIDAEKYTNPDALPDGKVLVVGSGQTGCQLAEEVAEGGREVFLACGKAPWVPRRLEGREIFRWLLETPFMEAAVADLASPAARFGANPQLSGHGGGHDLNYRTLQAQGVNLVGRFLDADEGRAHFAPDLAASVAFGDARYTDICELIRASCTATGLPVPEMTPPPAFVCPAPESVELAGFGAVIFTSGFRPDYAGWVKAPGAFDETGYPLQRDGTSTAVPGLHFMGVHFQRKRKSATLVGVAEDAIVLAERMTAKPNG
jgi:putative flavoprotein involved in K+ transport